MAKVERLWTDVETEAIDETVSTLRRARTAATSPIPVSLFGRIRGQQAEAITDEAREVVLFDARALATAAGEFFAARISGETDSVKEKEEWADTLSDAVSKYERRPETTSAQTVNQAVSVSTIGRLRNLSIDPAYVLKRELTVQNSLGVRSVDELLKRNVGVISPLSGDYLMATTYRSFLNFTQGKTYPLKLVAASKGLTQVYFEQGQQGIPFQELREVGVYLDVVESGNTGSAMLHALNIHFPTHTIFAPRGRVEFEPSKKIKEFWQNADTRK